MKKLGSKATENSVFISIRDTMELLRLGEASARRVVRESQAGRKVGNRILVNRQAVLDYVERQPYVG